MQPVRRAIRTGGFMSEKIPKTILSGTRSPERTAKLKKYREKNIYYTTFSNKKVILLDQKRIILLPISFQMLYVLSGFS